MSKYTLTILSVFFTLFSFAQGDTGEQNIFKSNLKIYVVVAVLVIILSLLFAFMFTIEKRLKSLENKTT
jgi:hypothetical protein